MKKLFLIIMLISLSFLTTGCKKSIVGKWKAVDGDNELYYLFNKDKTCSYEMSFARLDCTYEDDGTKITILYKGNEKANTFEYYFDGKTLIIKDDVSKENKFVKSK